MSSSLAKTHCATSRSVSVRLKRAMPLGPREGATFGLRHERFADRVNPLGEDNRDTTGALIDAPHGLAQRRSTQNRRRGAGQCRRDDLSSVHRRATAARSVPARRGILKCLDDRRRATVKTQLAGTPAFTAFRTDRLAIVKRAEDCRAAGMPDTTQLGPRGAGGLLALGSWVRTLRIAALAAGVA